MDRRLQAVKGRSRAGRRAARAADRAPQSPGGGGAMDEPAQYRRAQPVRSLRATARAGDQTLPDGMGSRLAVRVYRDWNCRGARTDLAQDVGGMAHRGHDHGTHPLRDLSPVASARLAARHHRRAEYPGGVVSGLANQARSAETPCTIARRRRVSRPIEAMRPMVNIEGSGTLGLTAVLFSAIG